jgi:spermidine/putrescine transport system substrate-binding protein
MKKVMQMFTMVLIAALGLMYLTFVLNAQQGYSGENTLSVYNWGDYIDPDLIAKFQQETGIKIIYQTFDSNEAMLTKIAHGGTTFDIAIPSDYAINKMKEQGLLIPLDHSKIPNLKHIDPRFLDLPFDENNEYSAPYFWGTLGIIYNPEILEDMEFTSWNDLWDERLKNEILLMDSAREVIGMGLSSLGYSLNETDIDLLLEAKGKLDALTPNIKAIVGDEVKMLLANEEASIGVVWSGDASEIIGENDKLDYVIPDEGTNVWFDNIVIPASAKNVEGAHLFINFMLDPENAAQNTEYVGYSTPNMKALDYLPEEITCDARFYPGPDITDKFELYENLGKRMTAFYNELFLEFKMHRK